MKIKEIPPHDQTLAGEIKDKIDQKTKPVGSLGVLEEVARKIALIQGSLEPVITNPHILVFAGDHGITKEGVSAYPQEVTYQMVLNFLSGGAAINAFAKANDLSLKVIDAGVAFDFKEEERLWHQKVGAGTQNFLLGPAMTREEMERSIALGAMAVTSIHKEGSNVVGFGEMGIGNTSSAALLMSCICNHPVEKCVGRGTGVNDEQYRRKVEILKACENRIRKTDDPFMVLQEFGGFEIAQMVGAMLEAAANRMITLVDGFISTAAFLIANKISPGVKDYAIFSHQSDESGHEAMLRFLEVKPLLHLNMRLGEGTGCALAFPLLKNAVAFLNEMASFETASVSQKDR